MIQIDRMLERVAMVIGTRALQVSMLIWAGVFICFVTYFSFGEAVITDIYYDRSFDVLNQIMSGRDSRSLTQYVGVADRIVYGGLLALVLASLVPFIYVILSDLRTRIPIQCTSGTISFKTAMITFTVVLLVSALPLAFVTFPPLNDYPFHIARAFILGSWSDAPALQEYYDIRSYILPNMGMDLSLLLLGKLIPIEIAGRIFIAITFAATLSGSFFLHLTLFQRATLWPLASSFVLFNGILLIGFTNYLLGIGLVLWAVALWIRVGTRGAPVRIACGTLFSVTLFFAHLVSFGLFAIIIAGYELQRSIETFRNNSRAAIKNLVTGAAIFAVPMMLFFQSSTSKESSSIIRYGEPFIKTKLGHLETLFSNYPIVDALQAVVLMVFFMIVLCKGRLRLARQMRLPAAMLVITFLVMPGQALSAAMIDYRLPVFICFFLISVSMLEMKNEAWQRGLIVGMAGFLVLRSFFVSAIWNGDEEIIQEYRNAFSDMPSGAMMFVTNGEPFSRTLASLGRQTPIEHLGSLAAIESLVFVPAIYAHPSQQPISVTSRYGAIKEFQTHAPLWIKTLEQANSVVSEIRRLSDEECLQDRPIFLLMHDPPDRIPGNVELVASGTRFALLEIVRDREPGCALERSES
jgi:hypothetical protein